MIKDTACWMFDTSMSIDLDVMSDLTWDLRRSIYLARYILR